MRGHGKQFVRVATTPRILLPRRSVRPRRSLQTLVLPLFLPPAKLDTHSHPFTPDWRVRTVNVTTHNSNPIMNNDPDRDEEMSDATNRLKKTAREAAEDIRDEAGKAADIAKEKASGLLGAAKEKLSNLTETARSAANTARERAGDWMEDARHGAEDVYGRARTRVTHWSEDGMQYVRENPAKAVFTALVAGVVLGFTLRRH
jgi:ElaB/YqjD/DUF883 family membrane-anchored ribosome-binding protein